MDTVYVVVGMVVGPRSRLAGCDVYARRKPTVHGHPRASAKAPRKAAPRGRR